MGADLQTPVTAVRTKDQVDQQELKLFGSAIGFFQFGEQKGILGFCAYE
jgi:hypothetical protein